MTKEEAIRRIKEFGLYHAIGDLPHSTKTVEAFDMAIEALQFVEHFDLLKEFQSLQEVVQCKDCEYQNECEEVILFDINDDEVTGHRVHWCSYGRSKK